ncbi:tryptophan 2,3-dioxygenase family protein [Prauserella oleivorans]|uniref:Tryptophan 2,3-dioxygenase family protein n=1 Tax=Prauserella oleivorans TaxID=1478153 RepID=A0ABW5W494_9PSEU
MWARTARPRPSRARTCRTPTRPPDRRSRRAARPATPRRPRGPGPGNPEQHEALQLTEPSVWDDAIATLARHGHDIPGDLLKRDFSVEHEPHPAVEAAWVAVLGDDGPGNHLRLLAEALTEVAERFAEWRYRHLSAVRRAMGAKAGTGGTNGIGWLERSMARVVFPELWSARTHV